MAQARLENVELVSNQDLETKSWLMGPGKSGDLRKFESLSPQSWKDQTFAAVTNALLSISSKKTAIFFIDDIQWADSASLALLHYISRAIASLQSILRITKLCNQKYLENELILKKEKL